MKKLSLLIPVIARILTCEPSVAAQIPVPTVRYPTNGTILKKGAQIQIEWAPIQAHSPFADIDLLDQTGYAWTVKQGAQNTGIYVWTVDQSVFATNRLAIRVTVCETGGCTNSTGGFFVITNAPPDRPLITTMQTGSQGILHVEALGEAGFPMILEYSVDRSDWYPVGDAASQFQYGQGKFLGQWDLQVNVDLIFFRVRVPF